MTENLKNFLRLAASDDDHKEARIQYEWHFICHHEAVQANLKAIAQNHTNPDIRNSAQRCLKASGYFRSLRKAVFAEGPIQ